MADSVRGNGLDAIHDALAHLTAHTARLDNAFQRFRQNADEPPPPYSPPHNDNRPATQPENPTPPSPGPVPGPREVPETERASRIQRQIRLVRIFEASLPHWRLQSQSWRLAERLAMARFSEQEPEATFPPPDTNERSNLVHDHFVKAKDIIRACWKEQGIWIDAWGTGPDLAHRWPHEIAERAAAAAAPPPGRRRRTRATEAAAAAMASRPYPQFVYQVARERDLLLGLVGDLDRPPLRRRKTRLWRTRYPGEPVRSASVERAEDAAYERQRLRSMVPPVPAPLRRAPADVHSTAYETVKAEWVACGIWDPRWTVLPGLRWMHEEPVERFIRRRMAEEDGVAWEEGGEEDEEEEDEEPGEEEIQEAVAAAEPPPVAAIRQPADHNGSRWPEATWSESAWLAAQLPSPPPAQPDVAAEERARGRHAGFFNLFGNPSSTERQASPDEDGETVNVFGPFGSLPGERQPSPDRDREAALLMPPPPPPQPTDGPSPPRANKRGRDAENEEEPARAAKRGRPDGSRSSNGAVDDDASDENAAESSTMAGTGAGRASQPP